MKQNRAGFTLIEMMISMAILGTIVITVLNIENNNQQVTSAISIQSSAQEDLRNAAAIIADEVARAYYIFPPCGAYTTNPDVAPINYDCETVFGANYKAGRMNVSFSKFSLGSGYTTVRPNSATVTANPNTWTVGQSAAPILAMIVAPKKPDTDTCAALAQKSTGCYTFVAYYPVLRSQVTNTSAVYSSDKLDPSPENKNQWVLMEYREELYGTSFNIALKTGQSVPGFGLMDIPGVFWDYVNCLTYCTASVPGTGPSADPKNVIQMQNGNIPAVYRGSTDMAALARFTSKMNSTVLKIGGGVGGNILLPNVEPVTGFQVDFPSKTSVATPPAICATSPNDASCFSGTNSVDERGATEVRIKLQVGVISRGQKSVYPSTPVETFASPRNLPAGYAGQ
jgi:prepilin-type N-terminal cleavage/methylation domain-containing protein